MSIPLYINEIPDPLNQSGLMGNKYFDEKVLNPPALK